MKRERKAYSHLINRFAEWLEGHISGLSNRTIKVIFSLFYVGTIFFAFFIIYLLIFGPRAALPVALVATIAFLLFILYLYIIYRVLDPLVSFSGFLFHRGDRDLSPRPDITRAEMFRKKGMYVEAVKEYRILFSRFPDRLDFLFEVAEIYRKSIGDIERASKTYKSLLEYSEDDEYGVYVVHAQRMLQELEVNRTRMPHDIPGPGQ